MTYVYQAADGKILEVAGSMFEYVPGTVITYEPDPETLELKFKEYSRVFTPPPVHFHGDWSTTEKQDSITKWQRENLRHD